MSAPSFMSAQPDRDAWQAGFDAAAVGGLVFDRLASRADLVHRALCVAGFEGQRIARGIGSYPVLVHSGRRAFWLVGPGVYQSTLAATVKPGVVSGYQNLRALFALKGELT